jgi:hypothetical protein
VSPFGLTFLEIGLEKTVGREQQIPRRAEALLVMTNHEEA